MICGALALIVGLWIASREAVARPHYLDCKGD
jgi:hypothetical protein